MTRAYETDLSAQQLRSLVDVWYPVTDVGAAIASGSFKTMGMIVAPCSVRTMSEIAHGVTSNLLTRAADVTLKERRRLVLLLREAPLTISHLRSMLALTETGELRPVYHATAVTYRSDPILPVVVAGEPVEEDHTVQGIPSAAQILVLLRQAGIPAPMAWIPLESANHWLGEHFFNNEATSPLVAFLQASEKVSSHTTKVVYDGLAPDEWGERLPRRTSFKHTYSQGLQDRIVRNWHLYGFR